MFAERWLNAVPVPSSPGIAGGTRECIVRCRNDQFRAEISRLFLLILLTNEMQLKRICNFLAPNQQNFPF
jgi:hypothetical protein